MQSSFINIGFGSVVSANKIISILNPDSAPIKRIVQKAKEEERLIDATFGRKTRAVIITDSTHIILSGIQVETLVNRFEQIEERG